jgi:phosphopantothenoylcysteine decarboxylase/phosphopantothenate--cysteine ligase
VQQLVEDGVKVIEPAEGDMACGEHGPGRLPEPQDIVRWLEEKGFLDARG